MTTDTISNAPLGAAPPRPTGAVRPVVIASENGLKAVERAMEGMWGLGVLGLTGMAGFMLCLPVAVLAAWRAGLLRWWAVVAPIAGLAVGLFVLPRTYRLMRQAVRILMEAAPPGLDVGAAHDELLRLPGVAAVHDLHIWTVTDGIESASAHVVILPGADWHAVLDSSRHLLAHDFGVTHATIQVEPHDHEEAVAGC